MTDYVTSASNYDDIAGRMRRWEPGFCAPEPKNYNNFDEWQKNFDVEQTAKFYKSKKLKGLKEVEPSKFCSKLKKRLSLKGSKIGIFVGLTLRTLTTLVSNEKINATA